jgi:hypothetical protein
LIIRVAQQGCKKSPWTKPFKNPAGALRSGQSLASLQSFSWPIFFPLDTGVIALEKLNGFRIGLFIEHQQNRRVHSNKNAMFFGIA